MHYKYTNIDYLKDLSDNNKDFICDMISTFLDQTPVFIHQLRDAYRVGNFVDIKKILHKMKPTLPMMGIKEVTQDILDLEKIALEEEKAIRFEEIIESFTHKLNMAYLELEDRLKSM